MVDVLDRSHRFRLGDNEHELKFTIKSIVMCEKELASKNMLLTMAGMSAAPLAIGDVFALFKWGLLGSKQYSEAEIEDLFVNFMEELGMPELQLALVDAVTKSGLLGKRKN